MNRTRQIIVNAQTRRTHGSRWVIGEVGPIGADFTAALETGRTIASCTWASYGPVNLSGATLTTKTVQTTVTAVSRGIATVTATVTLDNGEKRVQRFHLDIA